MEAPFERRSDHDLLGAAADEAEAFAVFYRRYERLVLGFGMLRAGNAETAADVLAETFAAAWLGRDRYAGGEAGAGPWLLGIARNKLRVRARRLRVEREARDRLGVEPFAVAHEHLREIEAIFSDADAWLEALPPLQRDAVRAHILDGEDYPTMAERLGVPEATARKRVSRGIAGLRRRLSHEGDLT